MLAPGEMGQSAVIEGSIRRAADAGAVAIVGIWGYYNNYAVWQSLGRTVYSIEREDSRLLAWASRTGSCCAT